MTPEQTTLVERIRELITDQPTQREVSMFGGRSFMINDKMIASAQKNGNLLVRVNSNRHDELIKRPGASQAEMGLGRTMGPGWIDVHADAITDHNQLSSWIATAMEHNLTAH